MKKKYLLEVILCICLSMCIAQNSKAFPDNQTSTPEGQQKKKQIPKKATQSAPREMKASISGVLKLDKVKAVKGEDYEVENGVVRNIGKGMLMVFKGTYEVLVATVVVSEAFHENGKPIPGLAKKTLRVIGAKKDELYDLCRSAEKNVDITGIIKDASMIDVSTFTEKK